MREAAPHEIWGNEPSACLQILLRARLDSLFRAKQRALERINHGASARHAWAPYITRIITIDHRGAEENCGRWYTNGKTYGAHVVSMIPFTWTIIRPAALHVSKLTLAPIPFSFIFLPSLRSPSLSFFTLPRAENRDYERASCFAARPRSRK